MNKLETHSSKQATRVTLEWRDGRNGSEAWDEICVWVIEQFGMPGIRYSWHPTADYMDFHFYDERDAIHFMLRWT